MAYTDYFEYSLVDLLKQKRIRIIHVLISLVVVIILEQYCPIRGIPFFNRPLLQLIVFISFVLCVPPIYEFYYEYPRYRLVRNMVIDYNREYCSVVYNCGDNHIKFTIPDIALFEVYRTVKDESYIGYVVTLRNGTRLRFTNRLAGVKKLQKDIEASGAKVEDKTWFDNKHLPENIYKD